MSAAALAFASPLLFLLSLAVFLDSGWPILFRQIRMGRLGKPFVIWKFRTMRSGASDLPITVGGDRRVTGLGHLLRQSRLDELPQLVQVLSGSMSLFGPRPEVPQFVDLSMPVWRDVLAERPGLLDPATLAWLKEEQYLASCSNPLEVYRQQVLPQKLQLSRAYLQYRTAWTDVKLLLRTAFAVVRNRSVKL